MTTVLLATACVFGTAAVVSGDTYLVGPDSPDDIQALLDDVIVDGDIIQLEAGRYLIETTIDPRGLAVILRGVVDEDGTPLSILDGRGATRVMNCLVGEGPDTVFENLVVTGGSTPSGGGGLFNFMGSSPTLINCLFTGNRADNGGGLFNWIDCSPKLVDCAFIGNTASTGGAMNNFTDCNPTMTGCTFTGNTALAGGAGGGLFNYGGSVPTLVDCVITDNALLGGASGGGMYNFYGPGAVLSGTTVCGNVPDQISGNWTDEGGNIVREECLDTCPSDLDGDGLVDGEDLTTLLGDWGMTGGASDLDGDGLVDGADLVIVLASWGACP